MWQDVASTSRRPDQRAAIAILTADLLAHPAHLGAFLHDLAVAILARLGTCPCRRRRPPCGRTSPSGSCGPSGWRRGRRTPGSPSPLRGPWRGPRRASPLAELVEAVVGGLVADLGALAQGLDGVIVRPIEVGTSLATAQGDQTGGTGTQDAQQFTTVHDVPHFACEIDFGEAGRIARERPLPSRPGWIARAHILLIWVSRRIAHQDRIRRPCPSRGDGPEGGHRRFPGTLRARVDSATGPSTDGPGRRRSRARSRGRSGTRGSPG